MLPVRAHVDRRAARAHPRRQVQRRDQAARRVELADVEAVIVEIDVAALPGRPRDSLHTLAVAFGSRRHLPQLVALAIEDRQLGRVAPDVADPIRQHVLTVGRQAGNAEKDRVVRARQGLQRERAQRAQAFAVEEVGVAPVVGAQQRPRGGPARRPGVDVDVSRQTGLPHRQRAARTGAQVDQFGDVRIGNRAADACKQPAVLLRLGAQGRAGRRQRQQRRRRRPPAATRRTRQALHRHGLHRLVLMRRWRPTIGSVPHSGGFAHLRASRSSSSSGSRRRHRPGCPRRRSP